MKWKQGLAQWRAERRIINPLVEFETAIESEVDEFTLARVAKNEHEIIDAIADIIVFSANDIATRGYDLDLVMKEVIKEISSRKQDPEQAVKDWSGEKWKKWREQPADTLYKADFSTCKIK